ncbi:MAG: AbrB/MazE/SpoVT family DNA-binding domain-containing protein [Bryobacterales bacterium]|nr:AbrB/MazE/SpoVT family DNA-binding domain-containing protein [Bryobacterales bacterium]
MQDTAKVFWSGRSQAVRLPMEFRFEGQEVRIRRQGASVILEPIPRDWSWLDALQPLDEDAADAALEKQAEQSRPELDELFR